MRRRGRSETPAASESGDEFERRVGGFRGLRAKRDCERGKVSHRARAEVDAPG